MKRLFDILFSFLFVLFFLPFGIIIALLIVLEDKGTVFYYQERIGQFGKPFQLIKFRSMRLDADKLGKLTVGKRDARITKIGYFIRNYKLDEFPQFINVLKGDMSIIGPRPEVQEYVDLYTEKQREILAVKPGITDYASVAYFDEARLLGESANPRETYIQEIMPAKIALNMKYVKRPTITQDFKIMWLTFKKIITAI